MSRKCLNRQFTFQALIKAAESKNGTAQLVIARPGKAMGVHFSAEVLSAAAGLFDGANTYIDHEWPQGAREGNDMARWSGFINAGTNYQAEGVDGEGLYGTATVFPHWQSTVKSAVDTDSGMSFNLIAAVIDGADGPEAEAIVRVRSVDYVVDPALAGRVLSLMASMQKGVEMLDDDKTKTIQAAGEGEGKETPPEQKAAPPVETQQPAQASGEPTLSEVLQEVKQLRQEVEASKTRDQVKEAVTASIAASMPTSTEEQRAEAVTEVLSLQEWATVEAAQKASKIWGEKMEKMAKMVEDSAPASPSLGVFASQMPSDSPLPDEDITNLRKTMASLTGVDEKFVDF